MENSLAILNLLERLLKKGTKKTKGNYSFICPFHQSLPGRKKLEVNIETGHWNCWVCGPTNNAKGKKISTLLKRLEAPQEYFDELKLINPNEKITDYKPQQGQQESLRLPREFVSLTDVNTESSLFKIKTKQALSFLRKRGLKATDILKYNIGICFEGKYIDRVIIPSYDADGALNYFMARDYTDCLTEKYKNPGISSDVIGWELYVNFDAPIILVEGIFDALCIKRNVIPLFGKVIHETLMKKLVESKVNRIYIALDKDARKDAMKYVEILMQYKKEIYFLDTVDKDFSELGFSKSLIILEDALPMTFAKLIEFKLNNI